MILEVLQMSKRNKEFFLNTLIIFLGKLSTRFIVFLLLPLYTAILSQEEYGLADLITSYITLLIPVVSLELELGVFRFLIEAKNDSKKQGDVLTIAFRLYFFLGLVFTGLFFIADNIFHFPYHYSILASVLIGFYCGLFQQIARGLNDNISYSVSCFIAGVSTTIANIILIKQIGFGGEGILISTVIGNALCTIFLFFKLKIGKRISRKYDKELSKELVRYSLPLVPNTVSWWIINAADRTVVTALLNVAKNGIYAVSVKFPSAVAGIFYTYQISWSQSAALHVDDEDADVFYSEMFDLTARVFGAICISLIGVMPWVFPIFVKPGFAEAYKYVPWAMFGVYLYALSTMFNGIYTAKKDTKVVARTASIGAAINLLMDLPLVPLVGIYATSISTMTAYLFMLVYRAIDIKRYSSVKYDYKLLAVITLFYLAVSFCYYNANTPVQIIGCVTALVFSIYINRSLVIKVIRRPKKRS